MAEGLIPPSTPEEGGNQQTTANVSDQKGRAQPEEKTKLRHRQTKKWFGLTKTQWREFAAIVVLIPWVWNDLLDSHNVSKLCLLAASLVIAQGLALSFFKPRWLAITLGLLSLIPVSVVVYLNSRPLDFPPEVFPQRIQLASNGKIIRNTVIVSNPGDLPVYDVILRIAIEQPCIPAASVVIEPDNNPQVGGGFSDAPINVRNDFESSTNTKPSLTSFAFGVIPAKSQKVLNIAGSIKTNSWANLSVAGYERTLAVSDWNSNLLMTVPISPAAVVGKNLVEARISLTNMPFGAILFTNGNPAFTNLPHLMLTLDASDFGGTSQLNLINDLFSLKNNHPYIFEITGLLTLPPSQGPSKPVLKLNLINDSALTVSNIEFVFNSARYFEWSSNGVWKTGYVPPNNFLLNTLQPGCLFDVHLDCLRLGMGIPIPRIRFSSMNGAGPDLIFICLNANDIPQKLIGFWMWFEPTNVAMPYCSRIANLGVTNNGFFISIPLESHALPEEVKSPMISD